MTPESIIRRRRRIYTPPFAGGEHPLDRVLPDSPPEDELPPTLTPRNRAAVTRPRTVGTTPALDVPESEPGRQRTVSFDPATGRPNEEYYRGRGDTAGLYSAYRNWEPHGGKRGFKNSLKAGLMLAGQAVRESPDDPVTAAIAGFGVGLGGATAAPNLTNRLRRQQRLGQYGMELKQDLGLAREQANIDAATMVPVTLDNGQQVMVPAKQAAALQSRQQEIDLRGNTLEARKKRWGQLGEHEAATDAQRLYNSGAADDSAELRAEIAKRLGLPAGTVLPPRGLGNQIKLDEFGNYVVISPRSGEVIDTGQSSYEPTKQRALDARQRRALEAAQRRTEYIQGQTNQRAAAGIAARGVGGSGVNRTATTVTARRAAWLIGEVEKARRTITRADELLKVDPNDADARAMREKAQAEGEGRAAELNALGAGYEAGPGQLGYPYYKRSSGSSGEDPKIRAYANQFFGGDYAAAQAAIKQQRGQK